MCSRRALRSRSLIAVSLLALLLALLLAGCSGGGGSSDGITWQTIVVDGVTLRYQATAVPATVVSSADVLASGDADSPNVLARVRQITGKSEADVVELLRSYDTAGSRFLWVLQLRSLAYVTRYWGDPQYKLGRWYTPSEQDHLYLPEVARALFALPLTNNAHCITLYQLKPGAKVIMGTCADMTWNTETFGSYATGGGTQLYVPDATVWAGDHAELNPAVIALDSELRYPVAGPAQSSPAGTRVPGPGDLDRK